MFPTDFRALLNPNVYLSLQIPLVECGSEEKCIADLSVKAEASVKTWVCVGVSKKKSSKVQKKSK